jgi:hypothetical protein
MRSKWPVCILGLALTACSGEPSDRDMEDAIIKDGVQVYTPAGATARLIVTREQIQQFAVVQREHSADELVATARFSIKRTEDAPRVEQGVATVTYRNGAGWTLEKVEAVVAPTQQTSPIPQTK